MTSSLFDIIMAPTSKESPPKNTNPLRSVKSFTRHETLSKADTDPITRQRPQRASTFQNGASPRTNTADAFETHAGDDDEDQPEPPRASVDMDDLPIELVSLTDSFIESLSAKVHPTPPNIDNLARLFQEFYHTAATHINTHISSLLSRQSRERSPVPSSSASARASPASLLRAKAASISGKDKAKASGASKSEGEQQMITAEELAERKRARKALEQKRGLLEEAVERRLCEGIYPRIYRHRTTQDEAADDKLRSKTAALAVVGIGLADLGVDLGEVPTPEAGVERQEEVRKWLDQARRDLELMNESRYPLGKLNRLKAAHKSIVDTLAHFHPSSSADEIMPMLIYTLITLSPEKLNVISDLSFIQRFRWEPKLTGEAAYCLTNLEAAISFLETVDLSTLRPDEAPSGPSKNSRPTTPRAETFPPAYASPGSSTSTQAVDTMTANAAPESMKPTLSQTNLRATAAAQLRNRRLSDLVNTPAQAFGAASDAVFSTADQGIKNITNSLGDSYNFFLGKLTGDVVPRTLDDARKLISTPPPDDDMSVSGSVNDDGEGRQGSRVVSRDDKVLSLIGGKKAVSRDRSVDSTRSARSASSSSKKVLFAAGEDRSATPTPAPSTGSNPALIDSVRNFGNSLNPMSRLSGIGMMRGFGRTTSTPIAPLAKPEGGDLASVSIFNSIFAPHTSRTTPFIKIIAEIPPSRPSPTLLLPCLLSKYRRLLHQSRSLWRRQQPLSLGLVT